MSNGPRLKGIAIGVSSRLQSSVIEVISVDECMMQLTLKHILGFMSLVAIYVPTEICGRLTRKRCSKVNLTLFWISALAGSHSLS